MIFKKTVFYWVLKVFFGSNTCYLMGDTHFFYPKMFINQFITLLVEKKWNFQVKKWGFDPKISFQECHSFPDVFLGSNGHFLTSYNYFLVSGSFFLANFMKFRRKGDILGENIAICSQT